MTNTNQNQKRRRPGGAAIVVVTLMFFIATTSLLVAYHTGHAVAEAKASPPASAPSPSPQARTLVTELSAMFEGASQAVAPSVVPIFSEQVVELSGGFAAPDDLLRQFFGDGFGGQMYGDNQRKETVHGIGSGVIVSEDGLILTNNHVVKGAKKLTVMVGKKKRYDAKVIGTDPLTDVAVIKIDAHGLPAAKLGNSDNVKVGEWVIAVGNPFQLLHTVTAGIISATGRSSIGLATYEDFIQTDASINPGNSGGALCDLDGNVIGINTAITSPSGANAGIGFAIPINMAQNVLDALVKDGKVSRGYLALVPQDIDESLAKAMKLDSTDGALVADVMKDGPADKAGIKRGDVIVEFNREHITDASDLRNDVAAVKPGKKAEVEVLRDGHRMKLQVKLDERPVTVAANQQTEQSGEGAEERTGLHVRDLTPDIAGQLGYQNDQGVVVAGVEPGSPAESAGLQRGDLIEQVNHHNIKSVREFDHALSGVSEGDAALLLARRGQYTFYAAVTTS